MKKSRNGTANTEIPFSFFDGYLRKPVSISELFEEICQHIKCKVTEKAIINHKDNDNDKPIDNLADSIMDIEQLLEILEDSILPRWESFAERQPMKEVAQFSKDLIQLGEQHLCRVLIKYGRSIETCIENFDIENMRKILREFPLLEG